MWAWYNTKKKILNFTKNKPTGGSPVRAKINHKYKFLEGLYFWRKIIKLDVEKCVST